MENKENESLKISAKLVDLEDAEEFLKKSAIGKEKIKIAAGDKKSEKVSMEVPVAEKSENFQAREDNCEELNLQDYQLELENRIRNLLWTISGDYTQQMKPDVSLFLRSKDIALYDGIKQGALAKFFDKDFLGMYLVKKIFMGADEAALTFVSQLCIEEAIGERICEQRPGIWEMQRKACEDILDQEYETMPSAADKLGYLRVNLLRRRIDRGGNTSLKKKNLQDDSRSEEKSADSVENTDVSNGIITGNADVSNGRIAGNADASNKTITNITENKQKNRKYKGIYHYIDLISSAAETTDTMSLIRIIDTVYNEVADPDFSKKATLEQVLAVTMEDLTEFDWHDYLSEEMYEDALESYMEQLTSNVAGMENADVTREMEEERQSKQKITVLPQEALEKAHTYVELNFGKTYLSELEEKRMNQLMCRDIHSDCSLYFTEGILKSPVKRNYQYEYAKRLKNKNIWLYHDKHRIVKRNIALLTEMLKKSLVIKSENQEILSDRGMIVPSRLWRLGRSSDAQVFKRELKGDSSDFVVDVLIDASGSQMSRQGEVALQAYIISEALSNAELPHRVMSYCTFWDYTILHRFREYDDPRSANENIFNYVTSSNNRDGLAIRAAGYGLLNREEEKKILIILSDGRPYDVIVNRPNAKNPAPYHGKYAITDTAAQIRKLRSQGVSVLGVFAGEEKDLATEKKIFGKDFAYIRNITGFSKIVGRYLTKQLEDDE
ncbi:nitric oxide reductase activation protein [Ruminococcus sp. 1001136sp1]|uniref:nitric oxide reductase activation protein n=1 Tax=unclassified Ruminococcus TaxID=2608920 RepID=UPI001FABC66B|nr:MULTISPECIES: nitric oxide reductase activation protein [unclassified Ruminococcus]MDB8771136.1 nitric oxide reductase activation protein [Ruminococcus sp. 1001136sp1]MDB8781938.1 nitric oxide reductase activation protein [Ruminococcus sp. 1001136sp1]